MVDRRCRNVLAGGGSLLALLAGAGTALAQTQTQAQVSGPASSGQVQIEEIVVTSLKREQALQDTPAVVSAFTEADLESIGVHSMRDYAKLVPNLLLVETQGSNFAFVNIRGISQFRNTDPSVAVVIDGVLNTTGNGLSQELFDVQQIEVLKGPQGALYGRNAIGGAINITTKRPTNEFEGSIKAGYGNGNAGRAQGSISGALVEDQLFGRIAFNYYNDDGFRDNITTGTKGDASQNFSTRARIIWEPTDSFSADLRGSYSRDRANAGGFIDPAPIFHETAPGSGVSFGQIFSPVGLQPAFQINLQTGQPIRDSNGNLIPTGLPPFFAPASPQVTAGPIVGGAGICVPGNCALQVPGQAINVGDFNATKVPLQSNLLGIDHRDIYNLSLSLTWDWDFATLTSVSSYDRLIQFQIIEQPPRTAGAAQKSNQFRASDALSQEFRLSSPTTQSLRWTLGAYIVQTDTILAITTLRDKSGFDSLRDFVRDDPSVAPDGVCVGNTFPAGSPNDNQGNCIQGFLGDDGDNLAYAFFGEVSYDLLDNLEIIASVRWDRDERDQTVITPDNFTPQALKDLGAPLFGDKRSANFDSFQPKVTLKWTVTDELMAYATYSEGFRSGGFNQPGIEALADFNRPISPIPIVLGIADVFTKQTTAGVEAGVKYTTPDRRLALNLAGFYTESDNAPTFTAVTIGTLLSQVVIPIDEMELYGFEIDGTYLVTEGLQLNFGFGLTETKITENDADPLIIGNDAPTTPNNTTNLGLQYFHPVEFGRVEGEFFLRADYQRIGKMFNNPGNFSQRNAVNLLNLRGGFETVDQWRIEGFAKNATNNNFFAEMFNPAGFGFPAKLRQWGFEVSKKF